MTSIDYFELALKNMFFKTSQVSSPVASVSSKTHIDVEEARNETGFLTSNHSYISGDINIDITNSNDCVNSDVVTNDTSYAAMVLDEMENLRKIKDKVNDRIQRLIILDEKLRSKMKTNLVLTKEEINIKDTLLWKMSESCISDDDLITSQKFSALMGRYSDLKLKEDQGKLSGKIAESENLEEPSNGRDKKDVIRIKTDFMKLHEIISEDMKKCHNSSKLILLATPELKKIQEFYIGLNSILNTKANIFDDDDVETCRIILHWLSLLAASLKKKIEQINEEEKKDVLEVSNNELNLVIAEETSFDETVSEKCAEEYSSYNYVCQESLQLCSDLDDYLGRISKQVNEFLKNTSLKGFIRNMKIAINTPINALSSLNAEHIQDKFRKITDLLRGKFSFPAEIPDSTKTLYFPFLIDFLSKKLISQGENMLIPSKPEDAFVLASIIVAIWIEFPEFGRALLAHFMKRCPYTIPAYWPQYKGQSEEDFYSSRGYQYRHDGSIEDQNSFLKRMTGIFMLYVAIMVSIPRKNQLHPYGLPYAWKWLAATINLEPRPDITAALLYVFLDMAGYKLSQYYGRQFWKVMQFINTEYMTKIEMVASSDFCGPVSRLKEYIRKTLLEGRFLQPKGIISANYW